jgi:hypothetical protein
MQKLKNSKNKNVVISSSITLLTVVASVFWFMSPPIITQGDTAVREEKIIEEYYEGKHVLVDLSSMTLTLNISTTTVAILPLLSKGKPGSYYETIGGIYVNDYKTPLHFSSIGRVYMPYSVHVFGNYFIHGIPYYPDGTPVSSTYSGGCIRLSNEDAKKVYAFIDKGTLIRIAKNVDDDFDATDTATPTMDSQVMTNYMVAVISLEALTQDNEIAGIQGEITTRRALLPLLIRDDDTRISLIYSRAVGKETYVNLMNQKASALGLTNTTFTDVTSPVATTYEDYMRFMTYISTYKSYIRNLE